MTLNTCFYKNRFRSVKRSNYAMSWNAWDISTTLFPVSCAYSDKTTWRPRWKIPLETPGNAISEALIFKTSLDASVLKNLCLWRKFQSCLVFIINLLLKNFLTSYYVWCIIYFGATLWNNSNTLIVY